MSYALVDLNQVLIASILVHNRGKKMDEGLIRHTAINTVRSLIKQFKSKYPNFILCCDNRHYWRKEYFPFYKAHRKAEREASDIDWGLLFDTLNKIRDELKENFPYIVMDIDKCEADDVIAVLAARLSNNSDVLVLSSDKDFGQLQKYPRVTQYSPAMKRFIKIGDPESFKKEHIIRGDRGDGIPNILTEDDVFVKGNRQKKLNNKRVPEWIEQDAQTFCTNDTMLRNYKRNQTLVDFDYIPDDVSRAIVEGFEAAKPASKGKMLKYFIDNGLMAMVESISDF